MNDAASALSAPAAPWPPVALRQERHFGDRLSRCYAERPRHLPQMLQAAHAHDPQAAALVDGARRWDWAALRDDSARLAHAFHHAGGGV